MGIALDLSPESYARRDAATRGATVSGYMGTVSFDWYTNELHRVRHHAPYSATERAGSGMSHFGGDLDGGERFERADCGEGLELDGSLDRLDRVSRCGQLGAEQHHPVGGQEAFLMTASATLLGASL